MVVIIGKIDNQEKEDGSLRVPDFTQKVRLGVFLELVERGEQSFEADCLWKCNYADARECAF